MKPFILCVLMLSAISISGAATDSSDGFAVVELFTSEGCSSCPPADRLLTKIINESGKDRRVYCLSFHVDYWDHIGWKDPYSDKTFSQRQRDYARAFGSSRIYTPQLVVNGQAEFVGSNESRANKVIEAALAAPQSEALAIKTSPAGDAAISVAFDFNGGQADYTLNFALVERKLSQQVKRGENSGRTLAHDNVVRSFESSAVQSGNTGQINLQIPAGVKLENCSVIAFAQNADTMEIVAAAESHPASLAQK